MKKLKLSLWCIALTIVLIFALSSIGYALAVENVIQTDNKVLNFFFNIAKEPIDYILYHNMHTGYGKGNQDEPLIQFESDEAIKATLQQRAAAFQYAVDKEYISQAAIEECENRLLQKNLKLSADEVDYIVAMQMYSSVSVQIIREVLPRLIDGTYPTDNAQLLSAMQDYQVKTMEIKNNDNYLTMEVELGAELYNSFLDYLIVVYRIT